MKQNLGRSYVVHAQKEKLTCELAKKTTNRWAKERFEKVVEFQLDCKG